MDATCGATCGLSHLSVNSYYGRKSQKFLLHKPIAFALIKSFYVYNPLVSLSR